MDIKNKRGELATQQIVLLIILIASFAILLFFLVQLNLGQTTEKEICHNSVVTKGSSILPGETVPLDCKRQYLCLTKDGSCEQMTKPNKERVDSREEVYEILANEMADCWWMFGEGKIDYVKDDLFEKLYCSICSQVAFDDSMSGIFENGLIYENILYAYMEDNKVPNNEETYLYYLYKANDYEKVKQDLEESGVEFGRIDITNQYYVMMGITSDVSKLGWAARVGGGVFAIALTPIIGAGWGGIGVATLLASGGAGVGTAVGIFVEGLSGNHYLAPSIIEVNSEEFESLDCKSISTLA